jgi:hypothetical protein
MAATLGTEKTALAAAAAVFFSHAPRSSNAWQNDTASAAKKETNHNVVAM